MGFRFGNLSRLKHVAGHSNTIPDFLKALGCPADFKIASDEYDNLFLVVPQADGRATLLRVRY